MTDYEFSKHYTLSEFIKLTEEPRNWITYLEIIIFPDGTIMIARPSHEMAILHYAMEKEHKTRDEILDSIKIQYLPLNYLIDKYKLVSVWYNYYVRPEHGYTVSQDKVIRKLMSRRLLSQCATAYLTHEYELAVERGDVDGLSSIQPETATANTKI